MPLRSKKKNSNLKDLQRLFDIVERGKYMWEATFDAIRDPVMIINSGYRVLRANVAAAERCGRDIRDLIGKKCYETFARRKKICPHCPLAETLRTGKPRAVEIDALMPGGDFNVSSYPILVKAGFKGPQVVHHYHDVTEERRLQRKLMQSEKMAAIGMLAGGVAHEINNPLAGILAFTQLLKHELPVGEAADDLKEIEEAARRCKKIVQDLLTFARPHGESRLTSVSLVDAVEQIFPLARLNLHHHNVTLETDNEENLPLVRGNSPRLQQVFLNLINNAAQAMLPKGGGVVIVRIRRDVSKRHLLAEVIDHGVGIKKEYLGKIFDPFFSTKETNEGTGLGLSICYSIVAEHGGKIEVESEEGEGSVFRVILPVQGGKV